MRMLTRTMLLATACGLAPPAAVALDKKEAAACIQDSVSMMGGFGIMIPENTKPSVQSIVFGECEKVRLGMTDCQVEIAFDTRNADPMFQLMLGRGPYLQIWRFNVGPSRFTCERIQ